MVELNLIKEEFCACRMKEHKRTAYFAMQHEMDHEEYKEKWEEERAWKREKAQCVKETYARGGEKELMSIFFAPVRYRVVKIARSCLEMVLRTTNHTIIYLGSGPF
jgi:hypothetical protein